MILDDIMKYRAQQLEREKGCLRSGCNESPGGKSSG